jgi:TonB family protein
MNTPLTFVLLAMLSAIPRPGLSQAYKNETIVYLDENGHPTQDTTSTVLHQTIHFDDTLWVHNFYRQHGHCFSSVSCSDADGHVLNGRFVSYSQLGAADTVGDYSKGIRNGQWKFYTPEGRLMGYQMYQDGSLLWTKDTLQIRHEEDTLDSKIKIEIAAAFPGGREAWMRYLKNNLRYPVYEFKHRVQGEVVIDFVVDSTGHIPASSVWVSRSAEFALDEEALRFILNGGPWFPAIQNGRPVKSQKRQLIAFKRQ